jgi:hypothetical protein
LGYFLPHQSTIKGEGGKHEKFWVTFSKENFSDIKPQLLQINPCRTDHGAPVAIGAKIDPFLKMPEFFRTEPPTRGKCPNGCNLFGRENIDIGNSLEGDTNRT